MTQKADIYIHRALPNSPDNVFQVITKIEADSIADGWSEASFRSEALKSNGIVLYAVCNETVCGLITAYTAADEADITNVAVSAEFRRKGIASALLSEFESVLSTDISDIFLEVRNSNSSAIALYEKFGFVRIAVRKRFYSNPDEDAVIMKKKVGSLS